MRSALALYIHVPFCASRCGYCDFNTYTASELGDGVNRATFAASLQQEISLAANQMAASHVVDTIFIGGGTPTLIGAADLTALVSKVRREFDTSKDLEITTEANPDSVDQGMLDALHQAGFTRVSFGLQSSAPHVLATLDRSHTPGAGARAVQWARAAGIRHLNLDIIYGTPGERIIDVDRTLSEVIEAGVDHVSAYSLIIEPGTAMARKVSAGEIPSPDEDEAAEKYERIDQHLEDAGFSWYEVSNWCRPGGECRHNLHYWRGSDWWGIGPGAHSHVNGHRWWNLKHPATYSRRIAEGQSPRAGSEAVTSEQRALEKVMLGLRLAEGLARDAVSASGAHIQALVDRGLLASGPIRAAKPRLVLTREGRLLADAVVRDLTP